MAPDTKNNTKGLLRRLALAGFKGDFVRTAILPDWWEDDCSNDPSLAPEVELRVARFLGLHLEQLHDPAVRLTSPTFPLAHLRKVINIERDRLHPAIHAGVQVAGAVVRSLRSPQPARPPPRDPLEWRAELNAQVGPIDLHAIVKDLWERGVPVLPIEFLPGPKYQGMSCIAEGRPVIAIGHMIDPPGRLELLIAHEVAHVVRGDCSPGAPVVDEEQSVPDVSVMEQEAERYSWVFATGGKELPDPIPATARDLAARAEQAGRELGVDPGVLVWSWASRLGDYKLAGLAFKALFQAGGLQILRRLFDHYVNLEAATETDRALLRCVFGDPDHALPPD